MKEMTSFNSSYHSNSNLIKEMIQYLSPKDICSLSLVSKFYHNITKKFDNRFKEISYLSFCSDYQSFNIEMKIDMTRASSIILPGSKQMIEDALLGKVSWKELLNVGTFLKQAWKLYNTDSNHQDIIIIRDMLYDKLMESKSNPKLRIKNDFVESECNSPFQQYLFDFLYDQQELYEKYNNIFLEMKFNSNTDGQESLRNDLPLSYFITDYDILKNKIRTESDKLQLQYARWYYIIDYPEVNENKTKSNNPMSMNFDISNQMNKGFTDNYSDDILMINNNAFGKNILFDFKEVNVNSNFKKKLNITIKLIKSQLSDEPNPLFFLLKCLCLTLTFYCQYTMSYLFYSFHSPSNPKLLLSEYLKRYKNYVETAIDLNDQLENVNVAVNYLYEAFFSNYSTFPKFSFFRLCMLIWNEGMTNLIDDNESMLSCIKMSFISFYINILHNDLDYYFQFSSFPKYNDGASHLLGIDSLSKTYYQSSTYYTLVTTEINTQTEVIQDTSSQYIILEQILSSIIDTFCNEYSVFSLNLFKISSNSTYEELEGNILETIENEITYYYQHNVIEGPVPLRLFVEDIIGYFTFGFYSERIINQLKKNIYKTIMKVFSNLINLAIKTDFEEKLTTWNIPQIKEARAKDFLRNANNIFKSMEVYSVLWEPLTKLTQSSVIMEFVIVKYLSFISSDKTSGLLTLRYLDDWFSEENVKIIKKNKQVYKEIDSKDIPTEFDDNQLMLLSLFDRPSIKAFTQEQKRVSEMEDVNMNGF